jgi:hypothetical protein
MDKEVEKPKEEKCSFCGCTGHTINNCTIFLVIISSG